MVNLTIICHLQSFLPFKHARTCGPPVYFFPDRTVRSSDRPIVRSSYLGWPTFCPIWSVYMSERPSGFGCARSVYVRSGRCGRSGQTPLKLQPSRVLRKNLRERAVRSSPLELLRLSGAVRAGISRTPAPPPPWAYSGRRTDPKGPHAIVSL